MSQTAVRKRKIVAVHSIRVLLHHASQPVTLSWPSHGLAQQ